ncbi:MAG: rhamnan synthesis F family protein [Paracoccus sp. (in: a-proteobacteria)]|uniref:rhamnan synthesis F family protein n=1 Tax=Paracoccus sp. TaxID=267 RepID=UPI0026E0552F|nr:rhamnan synthesis F family protein [Paracoccus sp. (in: a-proteobacteria)]MDO5620923.1 rhamnan synthesis F family protein [Paracoccus sp. (in: a-proteobacteria)]
MNLARVWNKETQRLREQLDSLQWWWRGPLLRRRYDRQRDRLVMRVRGELSAAPEMAVLLIYQPDGMLDSTLFTLDWLVGQGVAPVVVSNLPLSPADLDRLRARAHLVIQRPNSGYDFGGYREGILTILEQGLTPQALYVMNDSMWFPLREDCDAIAHARASSADMFGLFRNCAPRGDRWDHLQSYFFRFSGRLVASDQFRRYWQDMSLIDNKRAVIRRYERKLTGHFQKHGFNVDSIHTRADLIQAILALDDADLRMVVDYLIATDPKDADRLRPLVETGQPFAQIRPQIEALVQARKVNNSYSAAHPLLLEKLGVSFLKKGRGPGFVVQRAALHQLGLDAGYYPSVRAEVAGWDQPSR